VAKELNGAKTQEKEEELKNLNKPGNNEGTWRFGSFAAGEWKTDLRLSIGGTDTAREIFLGQVLLGALQRGIRAL
jgi:hypothetical protein